MKHTNHKGEKKKHDQMESVSMAIHETHQSFKGGKKHMIKWKVFLCPSMKHTNHKGGKKKT